MGTESVCGGKKESERDQGGKREGGREKSQYATLTRYTHSALNI